MTWMAGYMGLSLAVQLLGCTWTGRQVPMTCQPGRPNNDYRAIRSPDRSLRRPAPLVGSKGGAS